MTLAFYTPLPFAGTAGRSDEASAGANDGAKSPASAVVDSATMPWTRADSAAIELLRSTVLIVPAGTSPLSLLELAQTGPGPAPGIPGGPPVGAPGGGFPGGGFPGNGFPPGGVPGPAGRAPAPPPITAPPGGSPPAAPNGAQPGSPPQAPAPAAPSPGGGIRGAVPGAPAGVPPVLLSLPVAPLERARSARAEAQPRPEQPAATPRDMASANPREPLALAPPAGAPAASTAAPAQRIAPVAPAASRDPLAAARAAPIERTGLQGVIDRARRLFGLAPAPFVEGDFVAALRLPDGRWIVVRPRSDALLSPYQRRIALWFVIAFGITAPFGWLFARRLSRPLDRFADAAAALGRDPATAIAPLDGPAEIGRAAHAFNLMQKRMRGFVDDRTTMVGAISRARRSPARCRSPGARALCARRPRRGPWRRCRPARTAPAVAAAGTA